MSAVFAHVGEWTVDDYHALPEPQSQRLELYEGTLLVSAAAAYGHARIALRLNELMSATRPPDVLPMQGLAVSVPSGLFVPDLTVVPEHVRPKRVPHEFQGEDVLLVVEIESPSSRRMDRIVKAGAYAEGRIPAYWRIELGDGPEFPAISVSELRGDHYVVTSRVTSGERHTFAAPFPLTFDPAELAL